MYEVLDKDTIKSEILPHLSVAKHGCLDENVPPALRIHERWGMVANRNTTLSILLYKINSSYVLLTATACFLFSLLSFSAGDWVITIKGVLLGEDGKFPKEATERLIEISKNIEPLELWCGLTDMFMPGNNKVVVESLELPEIKGSSIRHRPFTMTLESDYVDSLIVDRS